MTTMNMIGFFDKHKLKPREQQVDALARVEMGWTDYKYFAISAPPGVGKTYIALSIADAIKNSYLLTATKYLQAQYQSSSAKLVDLKGRANYICNVNPMFTADEAPCMVDKSLKKMCISSNSCDYYRQKKAALSSQMMITNYAYFLAATTGAQDDDETEWKPRTAIIMDEAHELEKHLISVAEIRLNLGDLYSTYGIGHEEWKVSTDVQENRDLLDKLLEIMNAKSEELQEKMDALIKDDTFMQKGQAKNIPKATAEKVRRIKSRKTQIDNYISKIGIFKSTFELEDCPWVESSNLEENSLIISPLSSKYLFALCLDFMADKFVFMSATLPPKEEFCRELGIDPTEMLYVEVDTPFLPEKSPVVSLPVAKMNYKELEAGLPRIVEAVEAILEEHPNEKGLIHTGNYKIASEIIRRIGKKYKDRLIARDMQQTKMSNNDLIAMHTSSSDPTVLLSPSMTTGVDLYDDLARFQIIVKLPFPSLGDPRIKKKSDLYKNWYNTQMWMDFLQSSCRATRSESDYSTSYVLDGSFEYFYNMQRSKLPKWFIKRVEQ